MAGQSAVKKKDVQVIRDCAKVFFDGGNPGTDLELANDWKSLGVYFDIFLTVRNSLTGDFNFFPFAGGYMDQPYRTTQILKTIQNYFYEKLQQQMKSIQTPHIQR